ncbi:cobalamin 5-phosphate synthase [Alcanivorax sp. 97CO-5]|jgi:adenosylcobinamide-GDP ribazoletransferase|uniref:adenosylcobinamide-GDP ribazoletransferase n=1 Tax=unclassified Alcanivorax TaxID=2638842 RepID=UPI0003E7E5B3|nr:MULTISPECIES: adenosylcobinamide-GDP ribazoletransferase [unclassified Alcanivorax]EUC69000.1 cobalamin 5-phosphate synthase [Alcanivorax sp. 97CO-5]PKG01111.1 adenosylcobinamide-GDP ribazoletransferase [Alcanivorax sp. 97CO-6]
MKKHQSHHHAQQRFTHRDWQEEWQAFWLAVGFLTRIPMLVRIDYSQTLMNRSSVYFPLVGLLLGALYAGLFVLLDAFWATGICVALILVFHLWITGAFHEDGLADSVDALGGGYTVARRLEIMKDSRIGTYGTVALIMALGLKGLLLAEAKTVWLALLLSPVVSRLTPLWLMRFLPYVTDPNTSKSKPVAEGFSTQRLCVATALTVVVAALAGAVIPALLSVVVVALLWGGYLWRHLRGYTGDTLGASVVLCELVFLLLWG